MKRVIIAIDYNESAQKVAELGYAVGKAMGAEITLVHVITEPSFHALAYAPIMGYSGEYVEETRQAARNIKSDAKDFLEASVKHLGDPDIKIKVVAGKIEEAIIKYSRSRKAELIILGSHSYKGIERLFVTDVAAYLLKHSKIPVLAIPTED